MSNNQPQGNFKKDNYIVIKSAVSPEICQLLADYAGLKASIKPKVHRGKDPLANIHREYGDPLMETLLMRLQPQIEQATGLELWPTLSFYYYYTTGNLLSKHKDRDSCELVAGLCIGADENYKQNHGSWPLCFNIDGDKKAIKLNYGDIVVFKGSELEHWRDEFTGKWFVSAIFGYVDKNGSEAYQKYDQRKALGKPHVGMFAWTFGKLKAKFMGYFKQS